MTDFTDDFLNAFNHAMKYEVGGWWNPEDQSVQEGCIDDKVSCRKVGYVNDPEDAGGETKYGVAKNGNPDVDITTLNLAGAMDIYNERYWGAGHNDKLPGAVAIIHFDGCVNHGIGRANKFLQTAADVTADGVIGDGTLAAIANKTQEELINGIADQREAFYHSIVANKPTQAKFLAGWLARIADVKAFALSKI
jgi:lysozyme family protein